MARLILRERKGKHDKKTLEYYAPDESGDYHTEFGIIPKAALKKGGIFELGGETFTVTEPSFLSRYERLRRGAQIVQPKEIGYVIASTGIGKEDAVLDIGAGSGFSAILLSQVAKRVNAYEINDENLRRTKENVKEMGITNVEAKKGDAYDPATIPHDAEFRLFFLDVPEPWRALATAKKALLPGGWLVGYTPCITQAMRLVEQLDGSFLHVKTVELLERDWKVQGEAVRPESKDFQHTAFLTLIRKV